MTYIFVLLYLCYVFLTHELTPLLILQGRKSKQKNRLLGIKLKGIISQCSSSWTSYNLQIPQFDSKYKYWLFVHTNLHWLNSQPLTHSSDSGKVAASKHTKHLNNPNWPFAARMSGCSWSRGQSCEVQQSMTVPLCRQSPRCHCSVLHTHTQKSTSTIRTG